ncbi:protein OBERON 4-like [Zingiber officinale]|uniref:Protein OBERON 4 n=1 Tax=Zingiber officinale TaxID=94328 RepID=A0A8J5LMH9_ZINOF|nr:protein OBERON 4-like [Zingiber officinale]KAG6525557.1 hypothetical protein ZIOFF_015519 [Zingiber officinale]
MKRRRSSAHEERLKDCTGEKLSWEDFPRRGRQPDRSSSHRRLSYSRPDGAWKPGEFSYDQGYDEEPALRRRYGHDSERFDRRKGYDRHGDRRTLALSTRGSYGSERMHRTESFSGIRREFPKGSRSDRDRPRGEGCGSWSSWRSRSSKDLSGQEVRKSPSIYSDLAGRRSHAAPSDDHRKKVNSRDSSSVEQWRKEETRAGKRSREIGSEMEEGELEPEAGNVEPPSIGSKSAAMLGSDYCENRDSVNNSTHGEVSRKQELLSEAMRLDADDNVVIGEGKEGKLANSLIYDGNATAEVNDDQSDVVKKMAQDRWDGEGSAEDANEDKGIEGELCRTNPEVCNEGSLCLQLEDEDLVHNHREQAVDEEARAMASPTHHIQEENPEVNKEENKYDEDKVDVMQKHEMVCFISPLQEEKPMEEAQCNAATLEIIENAGKVETKIVHATDNGQDREAEAVIQTTHDTGTQLEVIEKEQSFFDLETHLNDSVIHNDDKLAILMLSRDQSSEMHLDKDKNLAISHSTKPDILDNGDSLEGPRRRGLELVFPSKPNQEENSHSSSKDAGNIAVKELKSEPLDLSLSLPGGFSYHSKPKHENSSCAEGIKSLSSALRTKSDEFGTSISFASSQTVLHGPSSVTQNSPFLQDNSVGSHATSGGVNQILSRTTLQAHTSRNIKKNRSGPPFHSVQMNVNSSHTSFLSMSDPHSFKPNSLFRPSSLPRQTSPTNSHDSHDSRSQPTKEIGQVAVERSSGTNQWNGEQLLLNGLSATEKIVYKIVSQPLYLNGRMLQEMSEHSVAYLKESICEMLTNEDKTSLLHLFQEALQRSDMIIETLRDCPQVLLEILVTIKTGCLDFIQKTNSLPSSSLIEIFLNLKCQNLSCGSLLPVDNCDCKMCIKKVGFCSACMCLVCSNFDNASNTCSWVGCDMCLHWCHTDCGLRDFHIRNGHISLGEGFSEMQFHCFACGHPSEMFGFVKEVFLTCAKDWKAETLAKELQYVSRIFSASNDARDRRLHELADQMLLNLENNVNHSEVLSQVMAFLSESGFSIKNNPLLFTPTKAKNEAIQNNARSCPERLQSFTLENACVFENRGLISITEFDQTGRKAGETAVSLKKALAVDELERIIKFKEAEAKMYQQHADDARNEAVSLRHIVMARSLKIDEDYANQIEKLRLGESEERRREKLNQLQATEKTHQEYCNMKMRMEAGMKNLLLKMEATRQNLNV